MQLLFFDLAGNAALFNSTYLSGRRWKTSLSVDRVLPSLSSRCEQLGLEIRLAKTDDVSLILTGGNVTITALTTKEVDYATASVDRYPPRGFGIAG